MLLWDFTNNKLTENHNSTLLYHVKAILYEYGNYRLCWHTVYLGNKYKLEL